MSDKKKYDKYMRLGARAVFTEADEAWGYSPTFVIDGGIVLVWTADESIGEMVVDVYDERGMDPNAVDTAKSQQAAYVATIKSLRFDTSGTFESAVDAVLDRLMGNRAIGGIGHMVHWVAYNAVMGGSNV